MKRPSLMRTPSLRLPCRAARGGAWERQGRGGHFAAKRAGDCRADALMPLTDVLLPFSGSYDRGTFLHRQA